MGELYDGGLAKAAARGPLRSPKNYHDGRLKAATGSGAARPAPPTTAQRFSEAYGFQVTAPQRNGSLWDLGQVTSDTVDSPPSESYTSDFSGNVTSRTTSPPAPAQPVQQVFGYDGANRLVSIARGAPGAAVVQEQLAYDYFGHVAQRTFPTGSDSHPTASTGEAARVYLGDDITMVKHGDGTMDAVFHVPVGSERMADIWGTTVPVSGCGQVAPKTCQDGVTYLHRDRLGSVIAVSKAGDTSAAVQWRYLPYGQVDAAASYGTESPDARSERGFDNTLKLSEGLQLMGARVYDPRARRFLQADNVDLQRYSYAAGDPVNNIDPSGHACEGESCPVTIQQSDVNPNSGGGLPPVVDLGTTTITGGVTISGGAPVNVGPVVDTTPQEGGPGAAINTAPSQPSWFMLASAPSSAGPRVAGLLASANSGGVDMHGFSMRQVNIATGIVLAACVAGTIATAQLSRGSQ